MVLQSCRRDCTPWLGSCVRRDVWWLTGGHCGVQLWEWTLIFLRCVGGGGGGGGRGCGEEGSSICMHVLYHSNGSVSFHFVISPVHTLIQHAFHFEELKSSVLKHSLLFERLMVKVGDIVMSVSTSCSQWADVFVSQDVKKTAANDDGYFVFEDTMHQVSLLPHPPFLFSFFPPSPPRLRSPTFLPPVVFLRFSLRSSMTLLSCNILSISVCPHWRHTSEVSSTPFNLSVCLPSPLCPLLPGNVGVPEYEVVYPPSGELWVKHDCNILHLLNDED